MSAHEKGIEAAIKAFRDSEVYSAGATSIEAAIRAYLEASDQVLAPRHPTLPMINAGMRIARADEGYWLMVATYHAFLNAYPQPFSQDKT